MILTLVVDRLLLSFCHVSEAGGSSGSFTGHNIGSKGGKHLKTVDWVYLPSFRASLLASLV